MVEWIDTKEYTELLKYNLEKVKDNVLVIGETGIGKTQIARQAGEELGYEVDVWPIKCLEAPDGIGLPIIVEKDGKKVTAYARPEMLPDPDSELKHMILLDEVNRAAPDFEHVLMEMIEEKRVGDYTFPTHTVFIGTANPPSEKYQVNQMDFAFINRFVRFGLRCEAEALVNYGTKDDWNPGIVSFLSAMGDKALPEETKEGYEVFDGTPAPRNWDRLNKWLRNEKDMSDLLAMKVCGALVGTQIGYQFFNWRDQYDKPVTPQEIVTDYKKVKAKIEIHAKERTDLLSASVDLLMSQIEHEKLVINELGQREIANLKHFVVDIPNDYAFGLIAKTVDIYEKGNKNAKEFNKKVLTKVPAKLMSVMDTKTSE